ncbi:MFS transporter [Synoicihabitans lomoniglobus]|uniref:MFS transporter n=1 Tax=Synoicihabitans lomoniglobus TaxID=2909285 RepID=A0AAF0CSW1_9BACT|nr:MFS transporter [Opitutaceae bacterium LMO-M01]WED67444.1 MFS transporter [Opitutaceae bacterium LMO-M01]
MRFLREQPVEAAFGLGTTLFTSFGQTFFISLFVPALMATLPITAGGFGTLYAAGTLVGALALPFVAAFYDTTELAVYTRRVFYALGLASLLMAVATHPAVVLFAVAGLRLCGPGLVTHISNTTMAKGFEKRRGLALGLSSLGYPLGEAILPPLTAALLLIVHWRLIWVGVAVLYLIVLPIIVTPLIRRARFETFVAADFQAPRPSARGHLWASFQLMSGDRRFWWLLPVQVLLPMLMTAAFLYQAPIAASKGWSMAFMASLFTVFAICRALTSLTSGQRIDRDGAMRLVGWVAAPVAAGFLLLAWVSHPWAGVGFFVLAGLTAGSAGNVLTAIWAELYGPEKLGAIKGLTGSLAVFSSAAGPALAGGLIQAGVTFPVMLTGFSALTGMGALCAWRASRLTASPQG